MNDSTQQMDEGYIAFTQKVTKTLRDYFKVKRQLRALELKQKEKTDKLQEEIDTIKARYAAKMEPLLEKEAKLKRKLIKLIWPMKSQIISPKRKSASTPYGTIEFKKDQMRFKIGDEGGLLRLARGDRRVRELFEPVFTWKPKTDKIIRQFVADSSFARRYGRFITVTGGEDVLRVRPTTRFFEKFDKNRLTDESENLGTEPTPEPVQATSPDA